MNKAIRAALIVLSILTASCTESVDTGKRADKNKTFEVFYEQFKKSDEFRLQRTIFPIMVTDYSGHGDTAPIQKKVTYLSKKDVVSGKRGLYVEEEFAKKLGYVHFIAEKKENRVLVLIGPGESEPAVGYVFEKRSGRWYLIEHEDYWGD